VTGADLDHAAAQPGEQPAAVLGAAAPVGLGADVGVDLREARVLEPPQVVPWRVAHAGLPLAAPPWGTSGSPATRHSRIPSTRRRAR
jgi:hypothetical protein